MTTTQHPLTTTLDTAWGRHVTFGRVHCHVTAWRGETTLDANQQGV